MGDCILDNNAVAAMLTDSIGNKPDSVQHNSYLNPQLAFGNVLLWGHPAWLNANEKSIQITAATEWVHHNRIWMAVDRTTVAEVTGSVKGVIPSSKLALYGDFRYDLDIETVYDNLEEIESKLPDEDECFGVDDVCQLDDSPKRIFGFAVTKEVQRLPSFSYLRQMLNRMKIENSNYTRSQSEIVNQWLSKWKEFLKDVMLAVGEEDPWTDTLLKVCCRFLTTARNNPSLMLLMEEEMPLVMNFRQLCADPIPMIELLSLPQPYLEENEDSAATQTDVLWLQLSAGNVCKLWPRNTATEKIFSNKARPFEGFSDASVGATNFLRRRQDKSEGSVYDEVEVPKDEAKRLLGSLINIIDGFNHETGTQETSVGKSTAAEETSSKNSFSEAHGERTESLFPHDKNIVDSSVNIEKMKTKVETSHQAFCTDTCTDPVPPNNSSAPQCNLSVPPSNLSASSTNLSAPPINLSVPPTNSPVPPINLSVPPPNLCMPPTTSSGQSPKLSLQPCNLTVPPSTLSTQSSALFRPSNLMTGTVPHPPGPVYYMPVAHYVNRESKYYNKFRRRYPQKNSNHLGMTQKGSGKSFMLSNIPQHCTFEQWLLMRSCNQLPVSHPIQAAASMPNNRQMSCNGNFQQSLIPMAHSQPLQIPRHIPTKLEKNNSSIQTEYLFKEMNQNRILQNISNRIPNTKPRTELVANQCLQLYYQSTEYFVRPVVKQEACIHSSIVPNLNYSMNRKFLKQYFAERQSTFPTAKISGDLCAQKSTDNPLCQRESLADKKLEFQNSKRPDSLPLDIGNESKPAITPNSTCSSGQLEQKSNKVKSSYFTQKWFSDNRKVYKTRFCNVISNREPRTVNATKGRCKSRDLKAKGLRKQILRKQKLFSTCQSKTLILKCPSLNGFKFFNKSHNLPKERKGSHKKLDNSEINTKQNVLNDSSFAKCSAGQLNGKDKRVRPITAEYLKDVVDHLLCDECDASKSLNSDIGKIDGLTHFKIAILEILRRTSLMLDGKKQLIQN